MLTGIIVAACIVVGLVVGALLSPLYRRHRLAALRRALVREARAHYHDPRIPIERSPIRARPMDRDCPECGAVFRVHPIVVEKRCPACVVRAFEAEERRDRDSQHDWLGGRNSKPHDVEGRAEADVPEDEVA